MWAAPQNRFLLSVKHDTFLSLNTDIGGVSKTKIVYQFVIPVVKDLKIFTSALQILRFAPLE